MAPEQLEASLSRQLSEAGVESDVKVSEFGDTTFAEITVGNADDLSRARDLLGSDLSRSGIALTIRTTWSLEEVGPAQVAYGTNGSPRSAVLYPVTVRSGLQQKVVWVAITKLAEMGFERVLGEKPDLSRIARTVIENALKLGGSSSWNPLERDYFEITSESVAQLSRGLRKSA